MSRTTTETAFYAHGEQVFISLNTLKNDQQIILLDLLKKYGFDVENLANEEKFRLDRFLTSSQGKIDMMQIICQTLGNACNQHNIREKTTRSYTSTINFDEIYSHCLNFAQHIIDNKNELINTLKYYETQSVAEDEIKRTLDLFQNLDENRGYFQRKIGNTLAILPRNQPLYALSCFALVPSLLAETTYALFPSAMASIRPIKEILNVNLFFPNVKFPVDRKSTIDHLSDLKYCHKTNLWWPNVDSIIFTGSPINAKKVQSQFDDTVLFIGNGAGHNPVIVAPDANLEKATEAAVELQLYNQGQDCASPSSILVHKDIHDEFVEKLHRKISKIPVGPYTDPETIVGPITKPEDLQRVLRILLENREWISDQSSGLFNVSSKIIEPTVIIKPLREGPNYEEQLSPLFFIQRYDHEQELSWYFETPEYRLNAMYITVFGTSNYTEKLLDESSNHENTIHDRSTILVNQHLHQEGVERGTEPYGGYGRAASWLSINGQTHPKPTLPQRDIYQNLVLPSILAEQITQLKNPSTPQKSDSLTNGV